MIGKYIERRVAAALETRQLETRETGYTSLLLAGLEATAAGTAGDFLSTGALEAAAGIWARTLAAARVTGSDALTARVRHRIGRDLIRHGESVHLIETRPGLHLAAVSSFDVGDGWRYRVEVPVPSGRVERRNVAREAVVHCLWSTDPLRPWRGIGPLQASSLLADMAVKVESKLGEDLATPTAQIVPIPVDGGDAALADLRADIGGAKGGAVLAETTSGGWDEGRQQSGTQHDWRANRLGPEIPMELRHLWRDVLDAVGTACGIPAALTHQDADGTAQREAYRRFVMTAVQPVADMIAETASEALETDVAFDFSRVWAHDLQGRAAALAKLTEAGVPLEEARRLAGLD